MISLVETVPITLPGHSDSSEAGKEGEGAAGELVTNVENAIVLDLEVITEEPSEYAVLEEADDTVEYKRKEDYSENELDSSCDNVRLVHSGVEHCHSI